MKAGVVVFPGTNCDRDTFEACKEFGWEVEYIWHNDIRLQSTPDIKHESRLGFPAQQHETENVLITAENNNCLNNFDVIFLPGGFSYGDYLRSGALAKFSPVIEAIKDYIEQKRGFVVGICNGFQILCEAGILPGALTYNENLKFICKDVECKIQGINMSCHYEEHFFKCDEAIQKVFARIAALLTSFAPRNDINHKSNFSHFISHTSLLKLPIAHAEGRYVADKATIKKLKNDDMIFLTYKDNPNGSVKDIAGIYDKERKIIGMMPHPERAFFKELGNENGKIIFELIEKSIH